MKKQTWKAGTQLFPLPVVMVSLGQRETKNIVTVAWTGIVNSEPPMTYISLRPERHSYGILETSGEFVINLVNEKLTRAMDLSGVKSGRNLDKFKSFGLTPVPASVLSCPMIDESPLNIECRVTQKIPLGSHTMFLAKIEAVNVAENLLDSKGRLCLEKANLISFVHGAYHALGRQLGTFGFSVKKK